MSKKIKNVNHTIDTPAVYQGQPMDLAPAEFSGDLLLEYLDNIPEEFRLADEVFRGFPPTPVWTKPGQYAAGIYLKRQEKVGPNESRLYYFETPTRDGQKMRWCVWGNWSIDHFFDTIEPSPGDKILFIYEGEVDTTRGAVQTSMKKFHIRLVRQK